MESITVSPNKIANIRRTLVNKSVPPTVSRTPADYDSDEDDDEERRQRRYEAEKPQPPAAVKLRKRIIIVRTKADGTQYRY